MTKVLIFIGMTVGSIVGSYIPTFWGAGIFSFSSILLSGVGAIVGIFLGYRISQWLS